MKLIRAREGNVMIDVVGALRRASGVMKLISSDYPDLDLCVGLCIVLLTFLLNMISASLAMLADLRRISLILDTQGREQIGLRLKRPCWSGTP